MRLSDFWLFAADPEYKAAWTAHEASAKTDPAGTTAAYATTSDALDQATAVTPVYRRVF